MQATINTRWEFVGGNRHGQVRTIIPDQFDMLIRKGFTIVVNAYCNGDKVVFETERYARHYLNSFRLYNAPYGTNRDWEEWLSFQGSVNLPAKT